MATKKDRRHSGYVAPKATVSNNDLIENDLFLNDFYDDWEDYRDGFRDWFKDFKKIKKPRRRISNKSLYEKRIRMNLKQKKLLKRRKTKKAKKFLIYNVVAI